MPVSATLVACIRFFVLEGNEMAESEVYRRNGVQSRGQHAPRSGIKVGGLEHEEASSLCWQRAAVASLGRLNILVMASCRGMQMGIAAPRESDGSSFAESHDAPSTSSSSTATVRLTAGPRRAAAYRPSLVPEADDLT